MELKIKMVNELIKNGKKIYVCENCGMHYFNLNYARLCEIRCKIGKKCYNNMIKKSIQF